MMIDGFTILSSLDSQVPGSQRHAIYSLKYGGVTLNSHGICCLLLGRVVARHHRRYMPSFVTAPVVMGYDTREITRVSRAAAHNILSLVPVAAPYS
eukprot:2033341-Pleurochrysis_carterae.AAC.6